MTADTPEARTLGDVEHRRYIDASRRADGYRKERDTWKTAAKAEAEIGKALLARAERAEAALRASSSHEALRTATIEESISEKEIDAIETAAMQGKPLTGDQFENVRFEKKLERLGYAKAAAKAWRRGALQMQRRALDAEAALKAIPIREILERQIFDCDVVQTTIDKNRCTDGNITQYGNERFYQGMKAGAVELLAAIRALSDTERQR